jgi:hypothetical protein
VPLRELLGWFGAERRGKRVLEQVQSGLSAAGLTITEDLTALHVDAAVTLRLRE